MRYLLRSQNKDELLLRKDYLSKVFGLWFVNRNNLGDFLVLESIPTSIDDDICIIYGHNNEIYSLFQNYKNDLREKNIFIITCETSYRKLFRIKNKNIFISPQMDGYVNLRNGEDFGFEFDISDVELNLYNSPITSNKEKLNKLFTQI